MTTKPHGLILSGATLYICSQNAFLFPRGMVRIWKSEGQDSTGVSAKSEYSWFFSGLVWWLVLMTTCHKLVMWVGSLTYRIVPDHLNSYGWHKCGWHFQRQPRWNVAEATLSSVWLVGLLWLLSQLTLLLLLWLASEPAFPGFNHWQRTKGSPGNFQVLRAWLGLMKYSVSRTEQLLGYHTSHCETANMGHSGCWGTHFKDWAATGSQPLGCKTAVVTIPI